MVALVAVAITLTFTTYAAINTTQNIGSTGTVSATANLGVYSNSACTTALSDISWGTLSPGGNTTRIIYLKNTGSLTLTLNMTTSNWSAGAKGPISVTWNQEATKLNAGQPVAAILTLTVAPNIIDVTNFSVQININGSNPD